ncbi:MAG: hypothetical protein AB1351_07925, partial [Thermoproteota archaeon]
IVVLGENNGLIRVNMSNGKVTGFEDIGYGLYFFRPSRTPPVAKKIEFPETLPIIVCNVKHLEKCIKEIEGSIDTIIGYVKETVELNPLFLYDEMVKIIQFPDSKPVG